MTAAGALGWSLGCTGFGDDVPIEDLGDTNGGLEAPPPVVPEPVPEKDYLEQIDPGFEGRWVGYVENPFERDESGQPLPAVFASGSTEVTLEYRFDQPYSRPSATLVFGAGPAPVPEPGVAYPPGVRHVFIVQNPGPFRAPVVEGFEYPLTEMTESFHGHDPGRGSFLTFPEFWGFIEWCNVQETQPNGDTNFNCAGLSGIGIGAAIQQGSELCNAGDDGEPLEVNCDFAAMCLSDLCGCDDASCWLNRGEDVASVFLEHHGDEIIGTISNATLDTGYPGWYSPMGTLRLHRAD